MNELLNYLNSGLSRSQVISHLAVTPFIIGLSIGGALFLLGMIFCWTTKHFWVRLIATIAVFISIPIVGFSFFSAKLLVSPQQQSGILKN